MIADISKWQGAINWSQLATQLNLAILKATGDINGVDPYFETNVKGCVENGIPFYVYHFMRAKNVNEAKTEAQFFYNTASRHNPLGYFVDVEGDALISGVAVTTKAFVEELRRLGAKRTG